MAQQVSLVKLGSFKPVPTSYNHDTFFIGGTIKCGGNASLEWRMAPRHLTGIHPLFGLSPAQQLVNGKLLEGDFHGRFSPVARVTLPDYDRVVVEIPKAAEMYAFSYPVNNYDLSELLEAKLEETPDLAFLTRGGYVYFDSNAKIVQVNSLKFAQDGELCFGQSLPWSDHLTNAIQVERFQKVTIPELLRAEAKYFCWIVPGEELPGCGVPAPHGGFVYLPCSPQQLSKQKGAWKGRFFPLARAGHEDREFVHQEDPHHWLPSCGRRQDVAELVKENAKKCGLYVPMMVVSAPAVAKALASCAMLWLSWFITPLLHYFTAHCPAEGGENDPPWKAHLPHILFFLVIAFCLVREWQCLRYIILIQLNVTGPFDMLPQAISNMLQEECPCIHEAVEARAARRQVLRTSVYGSEESGLLKQRRNFASKLYLGYWFWLVLQFLMSIAGKLSIVTNSWFASRRFLPSPCDASEAFMIEKIWKNTMQQSSLPVIPFWALCLFFWVGMCSQLIWTLLLCYPLHASPDCKLPSYEQLDNGHLSFEYETWSDKKQNQGTALQLYADACRMASVTYRDFNYAREKMAVHLALKKRGIHHMEPMRRYYHLASHQIKQGFSAFFFTGFMQSLIMMHLQISHVGMKTVRASKNGEVNLDKVMHIMSGLLPIILNWIILLTKLVHAYKIRCLYLSARREIDTDGDWYKDCARQPTAESDITARLMSNEDSVQRHITEDGPPDISEWKCLQRHYQLFKLALWVYVMMLIWAFIKCVAYFACEHHMINMLHGCVDMDEATR